MKNMLHFRFSFLSSNILSRKQWLDKNNHCLTKIISESLKEFADIRRRGTELSHAIKP